MCEGTGTIWVSGSDGTINQINQDGSVLKTRKASDRVMALSLDKKKNLMVITSWPDTKVYKYSYRFETFMDLSSWCPRDSVIQLMAISW